MGVFGSCEIRSRIGTTTSMVVVLSFFVFQAAARTIEVCPNCVHRTIKEAIKTANTFDTIVINDGTYYETGILIDKSLTIVGRGNPVLDAQKGPGIMVIIADHVVVKGLTFAHVATSYIEDHAAIRVKKAKHFHISDNTIIDGFFGIYLENASDGIIVNNVVQGKAVEEMSSGNAIHLWYCKRVEIKYNEVSGHRDGIYLEFVDQAIIENNVSRKNLRYGLHFMFSNDDVYASNTFEENGAGVAVMFSKNIRMIENIFVRNWGKASYGLLLKEIYDARIAGNRFAHNTIGIYVEGSTRINYTDNIFERNGWALKVSGGCLDNTVSNNDFLDNSFDLSISQNINENRFDGNYWSTYSGYDLDKDGTGDVPYRPVKLFNFIVDRTPEALVLLRSLFVDIVNFAEKVSPIFTPDNVVDHYPKMRKIH